MSTTAMANIFHTGPRPCRTWTGGDPNPINWTPDPNPINWTQPNYPWQQTYPSGPSIKTYVNCPHCGRNVEQQSSWTCSNCHQSLLTIPVDRSNLQIAWRPWSIPVVPVDPVEQPRENLPTPKEAQAGDGSRWEDI